METPAAQEAEATGHGNASDPLLTIVLRTSQARCPLPVQQTLWRLRPDRGRRPGGDAHTDVRDRREP